VKKLIAAGAEALSGGAVGGGTGYSYANTLLKTTGKAFLAKPETFQTEAFGNASLAVVCADLDELCRVIDSLEGNLTGTIYSAKSGGDDSAADRVADRLRPKVGRLLNDRMPTGVAVSSAMNHGGPFPATGHPGFSAVGMPGAIRRFAALYCYDNVRSHRLPSLLRNKNLVSQPWRYVDDRWTQTDLPD
jgi:NADP-dependent aldehyde dehydrogenase